MANKKIKVLILFILLPALFLQGCWLAHMPVYLPPNVPPPPVFDLPPVVEIAPDITEPVHGRFTLRYEPANTLNPIRALNRDNINISSLLYESLFILNENLMAVPLLCQEWSHENYTEYTFTIFPDIAMHDGSTLTASDVVYSIRQAMQRGRHRNKLQCISSVSFVDELTITITLQSPNTRFIRLMDVPIIKADSIESDLPPGTGPYIFPNLENLMLVRFLQHRNYANMPLATAYLRVSVDSELTELFDQGGLSLLWDDPTGAFDVRINRDHEPRFYSTTSLQFLGFNANSMVLRNNDVRRAIGCAIDRQLIVETIMNNPRPGQAVAAPVAISPLFDMYDVEWERRVQDPLIEMAALLERAGIADYSSNGFLEMFDPIDPMGIPFSLTFIVNIENSHKVAVAEYIQASMRQFGFDVTVQALQWNAFIQALIDGDFDLYYGEVQLGADFDFSPLLIPGQNSINYGRTANTAYRHIIDNFSAASTAEEVSIAGKELCDDIRINAPFIPILYKRHAIYTPIGAVTGATPSQSGVFFNFHNWTIDTEMLT